ncbi:hypothetical protein LEP1GSC202_2561 [Leptospira yanagawae serovar Saopaulo str. Sao Paulo = ATCC 700523]|uniref:Uncharacterized protein n=1 Tax=Leptospira yanagawae serovar Saopaulo str. Sao Paulo = ATCC 700523 TaxID=1249483 RepID=A0A5E8H721_9LEPT|nr:hypothetical protein LEP1GSC202_2561 [Leptospira yanagawae serovar Saopaulo str. Sao Paulo = ATCC 700523]
MQGNGRLAILIGIGENSRLREILQEGHFYIVFVFALIGDSCSFFDCLAHID